MAKRLAVQLLTPEQYERVFGKLREADSPESDPVLKWYRSKGWKCFTGLEWMLEVAKALGVDLSRFEGYDGRVVDNDELFAYLNVSTLDLGNNGAFRKAAVSVLRKAIGESHFAYAGQGMQKVTFVDSSGHAMKIGRCLGTGRAGDSAVGEEIRISLAVQGLECFPRLLAYAPDKTSYMCECAKLSTEEDFQRLFGVSCAQDIADMLHEDGAAERFTGEFEKTGELRYKVLADVAKYASENMLEDLHEGNWGLTRRGGQEVLIVIDYDM